MDEHSVMTYLSQFPKAKLKPGAPLRPKLNPKKARAYGPGEGNQPPSACESPNAGRSGKLPSEVLIDKFCWSRHNQVIITGPSLC